MRNKAKTWGVIGTNTQKTALTRFFFQKPKSQLQTVLITASGPQA